MGRRAGVGSRLRRGAERLAALAAEAGEIYVVLGDGPFVRPETPLDVVGFGFD